MYTLLLFAKMNAFKFLLENICVRYRDSIYRTVIEIPMRLTVHHLSGPVSVLISVTTIQSLTKISKD